MAKLGASLARWTPTLTRTGVGVGGWWPQTNEQGVVTKWSSPWFAVKVTPDNAPWAFQREEKACRVIATLEALGLLLALLASGPGEQLSNTRLTVPGSSFHRQQGERVKFCDPFSRTIFGTISRLQFAPVFRWASILSSSAIFSCSRFFA